MTSDASARPIRGPLVWLLVARFIQDPIPVLRGLHHRYGSLAAFPNNPLNQFDPRLYLMSFAPEFNERILTDTDTFKARGLVLQGPEDSAQRVVRFGLPTMNGEQHRRHRALVMPAFHRRAVDGYRDQIASIVSEHVDTWQAGEQRNVAPDMRSLALDAASSVLFGYSDRAKYRTLGRLIASWLSTAFSPSVWFFQCNLPGFPFYGLLRLAERLDREVRRMIDERRRESLEGNDVLSMLIRAHDSDPEAMTEDELVGEVAILFTAAHETNTVALTWTLFLLSQHPRIIADLADELDAELHGEPPRVDQFERLPLLDAVVKESLRILPPVAWCTRAVDQPTQLGPYHLTKGSRVLFSPYITHHLADVYPCPRRFNPERWLHHTPTPYEYLPFGGGRRRCVGYAFSMTLLRIAVAMIVQRFNLALASGARIDRSYQVTIAPKFGMPLQLHPRGTWVEPVRPCGTIREMVDLDG